MPRFHAYCLASLLLAAPAVEAAKVRLQVEGLTGDLEKNVRARLSTSVMPPEARSVTSDLSDSSAAAHRSTASRLYHRDQLPTIAINLA
ncbi:hypothetical protein CRX72_05785 [Pantoea sp. BRM17]|nr:hypothetical protein CRX72_05785 [Pantoea sp. BRM17]